MHSTSVAQFCTFAQSIAHACGLLGLVSPGFRSPPNRDVTRSIRRYRQRATIVSVRLHDRSPEIVLADMIDGVLAANEIESEAAIEVRRNLLGLLTPSDVPSAA